MALQQKMNDTQTNVRICEMQMNAKQNNIKRAHLTFKELSTLPQDIRVYSTVGRMYVEFVTWFFFTHIVSYDIL